MVEKKQDSCVEPKPIRPLDREGLKPWLLRNLEDTSTTGLSWKDKRNGMFEIKWKHASQRTYDEAIDGNVFKKWAIHTGIYEKDGVVVSNKQRWKANFRCALHSHGEDIVLVRDQCVSRGEGACRVYRMKNNDSTSSLKSKVDAVRRNKQQKKMLIENKEVQHENISMEENQEMPIEKKIIKKRKTTQTMKGSEKKLLVKPELSPPPCETMEYVEESRIPDFTKIGNPGLSEYFTYKQDMSETYTEKQCMPDTYTQIKSLLELKRRLSASGDVDRTDSDGTESTSSSTADFSRPSSTSSVCIDQSEYMTEDTIQMEFQTYQWPENLDNQDAFAAEGIAVSENEVFLCYPPEMVLDLTELTAMQAYEHSML